MRHYGYNRYVLILALALSFLAVYACSPEIHEMHKKPDEWKYLDVGGQDAKTKNAAPTQAPKPFGCDSRDLAHFSCE